MKEKSKWIIITISVITLAVATTLILLQLLFGSNEKYYEEQNERASQYIELESTEAETTVSETTLHVTEEDHYWDGPDGTKWYVRFVNTDPIYADGFLPYDEYGKMSIIAQEYLVSVGDTSSDCNITNTGREGNITFVEFYTEVGEYVYEYDWDASIATIKTRE